MGSAREAALAALQRWRKNGAWSDAALNAAIERAGLDRRDAALCSRLCYGTLQNLSCLDFYLNHYSATPTARLEPQVLDILRVGAPSIITMGLSSLTSFFINQILLVYSTTATAVYGVWMKLQNFCFMPIFGLNNGMVPVLSYNYGIGNKDRIHLARKEAIAFSAILMGILLVVFELIPGSILTMFSAGEQMRAIGMVCIRLCVVSLPFAAVTMLISTSMQALDHARYAMYLNLMRQCVLLIGSFALIALLFHSQTWIWLAVPIAEIITFLAALVLNHRFKKDLGE